MRSFFRHRGSILIWTLLLGLSLATVFFYFAQRLQQNRAAQRETMEYQNARLLMESYVGYLESLTSAELSAEYPDGTVSLEGITGTVSNEKEEVTGKLDIDEVIEYEVPNAAIVIKWNSCTGSEQGLLDVNTSPANQDTGQCGLGDVYDDFILTSPVTSVELTASGQPVSYQITNATPDETVLDNKWQLDLEFPLTVRKKISITESFIPNP